MPTETYSKLSQLHYHVDKHGKKKATKKINKALEGTDYSLCLLYTSPSPRD